MAVLWQRLRGGRLRGVRAGPCAFVAILAVVSSYTATVLAGTLGVVLNTVVLAVVVLVGVPAGTAALAGRPRLVTGLALAAAVMLVAVFVLGFPSAWAGPMGVGSDRANALDVAVSRLAAGQYPYTATTYLQNPITPLPGALLLAAPFRLLAGHAAWQNVAWTLALLPVLSGGLRPRPAPTVLWVVTTLGALEVLREFVIGDDLVTGAVPAVAAAALTLRLAHRRLPALLAAAAALGVATCTRPHLALVVIVVAAGVASAAGWRRAALVGATGAAVWTALVVPFLLGGWARFSPLHVAAKVTGSRSVTVGLVALVVAALALLLLVLWRARPITPTRAAWCCAAVLVAPSLLSLALRLAGGAVADLTLGAVAVPFALWALVSAPVRALRAHGDEGDDDRDQQDERDADGGRGGPGARRLRRGDGPRGGRGGRGWRGGRAGAGARAERPAEVPDAAGAGDPGVVALQPGAPAGLAAQDVGASGGPRLGAVLEVDVLRDGDQGGGGGHHPEEQREDRDTQGGTHRASVTDRP